MRGDYDDDCGISIPCVVSANGISSPFNSRHVFIFSDNECASNDSSFIF